MNGEMTNAEAFELLVKHNLRLTIYEDLSTVEVKAFTNGRYFYATKRYDNEFEKLMLTRAAIVSVVAQVLSPQPLGGEIVDNLPE